MRKAKWIAALVAIGAATAWSAASHAQVITIDELGVASGTISYDGTGGGMIGTDIAFDTISSGGTDLFCTGCLLNFETGANLAEDPWEFAAGGSFVLKGGVGSASGSNDIVAANSEILSGAFAALADPVVAAFFNGAGSFGLFVGTGNDTKHPDLLNHFGIDPNTNWNFVNSQISVNGCNINSADDSFNCNVQEADIVNAAVPEPASLALMGLGVLGLGAARRRRGRRD